MQLICISRGTYAGGKELAEKLAAKLGYACLSREEVTDAAAKAGIPVGRLEMSIVRHRPLNEQLAVDKERFAAFITARLAEGALEGGLVYHGRTGHLVLPTVDNVLRIRAIQDAEVRINRTMVRLGLSREKARKYINEVDEDRSRWARMVYNVDCEDPSLYDMVVNFDHMSVDNTAVALVTLAQLPEFQQTPASRRELMNLMKAAQCRLAIGDDPRTRHMDAKVKAEGSKITVTYPPRHQSAATPIPEILTSVRDVTEVTCTMAATNILWVQERYDADGTTLPELLEIAEKWNAAVTLVRLIATDETEPATDKAALKGVEADDAPPPSSTEDDGGILDDEETAEAGDDGGMDATMDLLIRHGRAGGRTTVTGSPQALIRSLDRTLQVSLVVIGDVFLSRSASLRKRQTRELTAYVGESLRVPVIATEELKAQYLFGASQWLKLLGLLSLTALMFALVMTHQEQATAFMTAEGTHHRILAVVVLVLFVPTFAYFWGQSASYLLRLVKFE
jgi:cytidylate kinase